MIESKIFFLYDFIYKTLTSNTSDSLQDHNKYHHLKMFWTINHSRTQMTSIHHFNKNFNPYCMYYCYWCFGDYLSFPLVMKVVIVFYFNFFFLNFDWIYDYTFCKPSSITLIDHHHRAHWFDNLNLPLHYLNEKWYLMSYSITFYYFFSEYLAD